MFPNRRSFLRSLAAIKWSAFETAYGSAMFARCVRFEIRRPENARAAGEGHGALGVRVFRNVLRNVVRPPFRNRGSVLCLANGSRLSKRAVRDSHRWGDR